MKEIKERLLLISETLKNINGLDKTGYDMAQGKINLAKNSLKEFFGIDIKQVEYK